MRPVATAMKQSPKATMDLPEPVGVPRITESPTAKSMSASSWWGHSSMPRASTHSKNTSSASSGVSTSPSPVSAQGRSHPSEPGSKGSTGAMGLSASVRAARSAGFAASAAMSSGVS